jgi:hypothetical protein
MEARKTYSYRRASEARGSRRRAPARSAKPAWPAKVERSETCAVPHLFHPIGTGKYSTGRAGRRATGGPSDAGKRRTALRPRQSDRQGAAVRPSETGQRPSGLTGHKPAMPAFAPPLPAFLGGAAARLCRKDHHVKRRPARGGGWPHVWLGATVENTTEAQRRFRSC